MLHQRLNWQQSCLLTLVLFAGAGGCAEPDPGSGGAPNGSGGTQSGRGSGGMQSGGGGNPAAPSSGGASTGGDSGSGGSATGSGGGPTTDDLCPDTGDGAAAALTVSPHILVDQFGYQPDMTKVGVLSDPQSGANSGDSFDASGATYEVRCWSDDSVVETGDVTAWNAGATDGSSGDRGWWFDFTGVSGTGAFYLYDTKNRVRSHKFEISPRVYRNVLAAAVRMFFYNRAGIAKVAPYTDARWVDAGVAYPQDAMAVNLAGANPRDMSGGWFDAGDTNKYVTNTYDSLLPLLTAFQMSPDVFADDYNIPESGNGLPDILDEAKWELDWLKRMQNGDGSLHLKVGLMAGDNGGASPPLSLDDRTRYYLPTCTSATIAGAAMFAQGALVLKDFSSETAYASDLEARAVNAWDRYTATATKQTDCDDQTIRAGDADRSEEAQGDTAVVTAIYLFALTGEAKYNSYVTANYSGLQPMTDPGWGRYFAEIGDAFLFYAALPGADSTTRDAILARKNSIATNVNHEAYLRVLSDNDLYRSYLHERQYHWGSNKIRSNYGNSAYDMVAYGLDTANESVYLERASGVLNYLHGVNPMGITYLTNMYDYGAEKSANEMFHSWFEDGSDWDNAVTSSKGPAPGFLVGGPNAAYNGDAEPLASGQPRQKMYLDWNGNTWSGPYKDRSWEVTEPSITYQAAYVKLLSKFVD